jgi:malate dehydrogenase (oxaloacetate-decarboxylating)(NADP+)
MDRLNRFVFRSGLIMKPIIQNAAKDPKKIIYAEGEDERVLRAAQVLLEDGIAKPVLVGRPEVLTARCERFGLKIRPDVDFEFVNPQDDPRYRDYVDEYLECVGRKGHAAEQQRGPLCGPTPRSSRPSRCAAAKRMR